MGNSCCEKLPQIKLSKKKSSTSKTSSLAQNQNNFILNQNIIINSSFTRNKCRSTCKLQVIGQIGKGIQGNVFYCKITPFQVWKPNEDILQTAAKIYNKRKIIHQNSKDHIKLESKILTQFQCPFLIKSYAVCENEQNIEFFLPVMKGGDLYSFLETTRGKGDNFKKLGISGIKFILCGLVIALQYLHQKKIIYRDLKSENILIDSDGYPVLTDFGHAISQKEKDPSIKGSVQFLAPQILSQNQIINRSVDFWSLGILIYFLAFQRYPFCPQQITSGQFKQICKQKQGKYSLRNVQKFWKDPLKEKLQNLLNKLLVVNASPRLGVKDIQKLKRHELFDDIDWIKYQQKEYESPIKAIVDKYPLIVQQYAIPKTYTKKQIFKNQICLINSVKTMDTVGQ